MNSCYFKAFMSHFLCCSVFKEQVVQKDLLNSRVALERNHLLRFKGMINVCLDVVCLIIGFDLLNFIT